LDESRAGDPKRQSRSADAIELDESRAGGPKRQSRSADAIELDESRYRSAISRRLVAAN
jgi:hypothetical protein